MNPKTLPFQLYGREKVLLKTNTSKRRLRLRLFVGNFCFCGRRCIFLGVRAEFEGWYMGLWC
jgi:hypothetical protein